MRPQGKYNVAVETLRQHVTGAVSASRGRFLVVEFFVGKFSGGSSGIQRVPESPLSMLTYSIAHRVLSPFCMICSRACVSLYTRIEHYASVYISALAQY